MVHYSLKGTRKHLRAQHINGEILLKVHDEYRYVFIVGMFYYVLPMMPVCEKDIQFF